MSYPFFLVPLLPPFQPGVKPGVEMGELDDLLFSQMDKEGLAQLRLLKLRYDIENIRRAILKKEHDTRSNYSEIELQEAVSANGMLPDFIFEWLKKYGTEELRLRHFYELYDAYYHYIEERGSPFLKALFSEEKEILIQFSQLREGKKGANVPDEFVKLYERNPIDIERGILEYKFNKIDEWIGLNLFSKEAVLAYAAKFYLNEELIRLDPKKGDKLLELFEKGDV